MQLKSMIKSYASQKHISAQLVLQNYMLERLLERISVSDYRQNFILKGGFLIASIVGINTRTTMDMDATIMKLALNEKSLKKMFREIIDIQLSDNVYFSLQSITDIRKHDEYNGYRISLFANYPPMKVPLKLDITTGDKITPKEINYSFKLFMEERSISILAYNLETILSEKLETVLSRADQNTRLRDYYDIYVLYNFHYSDIDINTLKLALHATTVKRESQKEIENYREILFIVKNSKDMQKLWENYAKQFEYTRGINFVGICDVIEKIMNIVESIE